MKMLTVGFILGALLLVGTGRAHRLSGHPQSLKGKLTLARAQVKHDRAVVHSLGTRGWLLLTPLPFEALSHQSWLAEDTRYVKRLTRLLNPRRRVDGCLSALISRESGWNVHAKNPRTGAYGLPQALPGSKMAAAGPNWRHDATTQIRWMVGYVNARYGGSCAALSFQKANGYY